MVEAGHPTTCNVIVGSADAGDDDAVGDVVAVAIAVLAVGSVDDDPLSGEELEQALNSTIRPHSNNPRPTYIRLKHIGRCLGRCSFNCLRLIMNRDLINIVPAFRNDLLPIEITCILFFYIIGSLYPLFDHLLTEPETDIGQICLPLP